MNEKSVHISELFNQFHKDVYHFALYFTNNQQDAEDITQETFLKVMKNLHQLKDSQKVKTWILSITRFTAVDWIRKQHLRRVFTKALSNKSYEADMNSRSVIGKENWEDLQRALIKLKPHFRSVIILRGLNELSIKETAEVLQCSEGKVRVDFHRALLELKKDIRLKEGWESYDRS
ncbi:RNA polymerase sigma factor [Sporosarcina sp. ITBMC105]